MRMKEKRKRQCFEVKSCCEENELIPEKLHAVKRKREIGCGVPVVYRGMCLARFFSRR
jgi:hypothetical protein